MDGHDVLEAAGACQALLGAAVELVRVLGTFATVLASVVDTSPPAARGWHPFGQSDAAGFAAMGCDELAERRSGIDAAFT